MLTIATVSGVVLGVIVGLTLRASTDLPWTHRQLMYTNFLGELFLRMLKGLILPLIISSLIAAIGSLDLTLSGRIGARAISYYMITTFMAVILGIILVTTIRPGIDRGGSVVNQTEKNITTTFRQTTTTDTMLDLVRNMFPPNIIQACLQQYQSMLVPSDNPGIPKEEWKISHEYTDGMNIMGLVVCAVVCGIAMSTMHGKVDTLLKFVTQLSEITMKITGWVIRISPIGIFFLVVSQIVEMENLNVLFGKLGLYFLTVSGGILFHGFVVLPAIYFFFTRRNPYKFLIGMSQAIATAFGTASSSATLPVSIQCLEENNHVNSHVVRFMLPIGATINMDGTALYEAVAAIFIAQLRGIALSFGNVVAICITATAASIGAAGIPQAGLVTLVMVLDTVGLPPEDVTLILAVDWLLDRIRTVVNVLGDAYGTGIVQQLSRNELDANTNQTANTSSVAISEKTSHEEA